MLGTMLFPIVTFDSIPLGEANQLLERWGHKMGWAWMRLKNVVDVFLKCCYDFSTVEIGRDNWRKKMATITYKPHGENVQANIRFNINELVPVETLADVGKEEMLSECARFLRLHFEGTPSIIDGDDIIAVKTYNNELSEEMASVKISEAIQSAIDYFT